MRSPSSAIGSTVYGSLVPPSQEKKYGDEDLKPKKKGPSRGQKRTNASFLVKLMVLSILACQSHAIDLKVVIEPFGETVDCFFGWDVETRNFGIFSDKREIHIWAERLVANGPSLIPYGQTAPWAPPHWQLQGLYSSRTGDKSAFAVRLDNLDLVGFTNWTGHWHTFEGLEYLIPGSVGLGFKNDYDSLIGGHMKLLEVDLRKSSILDTLAITSNHDPNTANVDELKLSLAKFKVVTSETQKFRRINMEMDLGWLSHAESFMRNEDAEYVLLWEQICEAILFWKETGSWEGGRHAHLLSQVGINNAQQAMGLVRLVGRPSPMA